MKHPPGFILPVQPIERDKPPAGSDWIHEIKHDGYRMLVRRDGERVRLWTRNAVDLTDRVPAIAAAAARIKANSFTIDGEAVVLGPDGLSRFDELRRLPGARRAMLYAFDLVELNGNDLRDCSLIADRVRPRLQARRRGHRVEADRLALSVGAALGLD